MKHNEVCEFFGCTIEHDHIFRLGKDVRAYGVKPTPLRWHVCTDCGWNDLMPVGSKPWTCDLCKKKRERDNG